MRQYDRVFQWVRLRDLADRWDIICGSLLPLAIQGATSVPEVPGQRRRSKQGSQHDPSLQWVLDTEGARLARARSSL